MTTPLQFRPGPPALALTAPQRSFERKVSLSKLALVLEQAWPRVWMLAGLALVFTTVSLLGLWPALPDLAHKGILAAFALAAGAVLISLASLCAPSRDAAIRRIEQRSGVPHRPASAYEDTVSATADDPVSAQIWTAHKSRLAAAMARLRVGSPSPRADRRDPFALRALGLMGVVALTVLVGDAARDRLAAAFRFGPQIVWTDTRLDAWVTPPAYTNMAPLMLADGAQGLAGLKLQGSGPATVPTNSVLIVRSAGGIPGLALEVTLDAVAGAAQPKPIRIEMPKPGAALQTDGTAAADGKAASRTAAAGAEAAGATPLQAEAVKSEEEPAPAIAGELKATLVGNGTVRVLSGTNELVKWAFVVTPDLPPKVSFTRQPERTLHGALRIPYAVEDDYGVVSLVGHLARIPQKADTSTNAWARPQKVKGPRPPLERPPQLTIRLPKSYPKSAAGISMHEVGDHIWAGLPVTLTLVAKDSANQSGQTDARKMVLPARQFRKPLAMAVVEQRRDLVDDPRQRPHVLAALDALTLAPETSIKDLSVYLGLRSVYWRLSQSTSRATRNSCIAELWQIALRIEDGALSDAERALKDIQNRLSKALENGASDEEIRQLMQELRTAMAKFLDELSRQAQNQPPMNMEGQDQNQMLSQNDLERMLQDLENMSRLDRDQAQQRLSELRDLLEQLQSGRMAQGQGQGQGNAEAQKLMKQLGELLGKEQQLLDDTFRQQQQNGDGQAGEDDQNGMGQQGPGLPGQTPGQGRPGHGKGGKNPGNQQGQQGQGQQGQNGKGGKGGGQQGQDPGQGLGGRQQALRDLLDALKQGLDKNGLQAPGDFGEAGKSMKEAEQALRQGDMDGAADAEQRALDQLRKGARQMVEQMMKNGQRMGQGRRGPVDPMGRSSQSQMDGSDPGNSVKVPNEIDVQRAREILEELRKRLGENTRPTYELDYLERLLKQF